jgi:hypothetical protein
MLSPIKRGSSQLSRKNRRTCVQAAGTRRQENPAWNSVPVDATPSTDLHASVLYGREMALTIELPGYSRPSSPVATIMPSRWISSAVSGGIMHIYRSNEGLGVENETAYSQQNAAKLTTGVSADGI